MTPLSVLVVILQGGVVDVDVLVYENSDAGKTRVDRLKQIVARPEYSGITVTGPLIRTMLAEENECSMTP
jgi:hypothetical protein